MDYGRLLDGKAAIVTGGAQGIGKEIALLFARHGARVAICDVVADRGRETEALLRALHPDCFFSTVDTGDPEAIMAFARRAEEALGPIDILDNNVGININESVIDHLDASRERVFDVNLRSAFLLSRHFAPKMAQRGGGAILFTSTIHAHAAIPVFSSYSASKGAIGALMRSIQAEYGDRGVRCNVVSPGGIRSSKWQDRAQRLTEQQLDSARWVLSDPLAYSGECIDIANAHLFFASDLSRQIQGRHLLVDTGAYAKLHAFPTYDYPDGYPVSARMDYLKQTERREEGMGIYDRLGVKKYINAWDTMSVIGGSRMHQNVLDAMREASHDFVELKQLQRRVGEEIAKWTNNESAFVTSGASAGILYACAVCMALSAGGGEEVYEKIPRHTHQLPRNEIVVMKGHRNPYDFAINVSGAKLVEAGREEGCTAQELQSAFGDRTAAMLYFDTHYFSGRGVSLDEAIQIAHRNGAYLIVDGAAQLPPKENLWHYTRDCGADAALFSGGKGLRGPQQGGLAVGRKQILDGFYHVSSPHQGLGRSSKLGREEIAGVYAALKTYLAPGFVEQKQNYLADASQNIIQRLNDSGYFDCHVIVPGPTGQTYQWVFAKIVGDFSAQALAEALKQDEPGVLVGAREDGVTVNPLNLTPQEVDVVIWQLIKHAKALANASAS